LTRFRSTLTLLVLSLIVVSVSALAEEDCVFDETAYIKFINKYSTENRNAKIDADGKTLIVNRDYEEIIVKGGGCVHLGVAIELRTTQAYTEKEFLKKTLDLAVEFGSWLINTNALADSIEKGKYEIIDGTYYIEVDAMTVFSASYDNKGKINVDFYIN
jgi:hypothetical protein